MKEKLIELIKEVDRMSVQNMKEGKLVTDEAAWEFFADLLIANGITMTEYCQKAESAISNTGLMCTACYSDIDRDAVFCKYCGAKVLGEPSKGE